MERQTQVLDASVIVKWFSKEELSDVAINLRDKHINREINIVITEITFNEVLNALKYKKKSQEELKKVNEYLWNTQLTIIKTTKEILNKTIELSIKHNLTIYDSLYLSIAEIYDCPLITADSNLSSPGKAIHLNDI